MIAEGTSIAYRGATAEVQAKLRRVIEVWRQRQIFETGIQDAIEARIEELDKSKGSTKRTLGGSLFSSSSSSGSGIPSELQTIATSQIALSKANATATSTVPTADTEYAKLTDPEKAVPTPPVHAARLSALLKSLASAESAVSESLKARRTLVDGLGKLLEEHRTKLTEEEAQHQRLSERKTAIESKKREVEDGIMRGLSAENSPTTPSSSNRADPRINGQQPLGNGSPGAPEPDRPDVEELTPPPEAPPAVSTPVPQSTAAAAATLPTPSPIPSTARTPEPAAMISGAENGNAYSNSMPTPQQQQQQTMSYPQAGADLLSSLNVPGVRAYSGSPGPAQGVKRRRVDEESAAVFGGGEGDALSELDEDVAELLRQESGGAAR